MGQKCIKVHKSESIFFEEHFSITELKPNPIVFTHSNGNYELLFFYNF